MKHFVYMVYTRIDPTVADEYREWQETEHLPWLLGVPGYLHNRRLQSAKTPNAFLNIWTIVSEEVFASPIKQQVSNSPWSVRLRRYRTTDIHFYDESDDYGERELACREDLRCTLLSLSSQRCEEAFRLLTACGLNLSVQMLRARKGEKDVLVLEYSCQEAEAVEEQMCRLELRQEEREDYQMLPVPQKQEPFHNSGVKNVWPLT